MKELIALQRAGFICEIVKFGNREVPNQDHCMRSDLATLGLHNVSKCEVNWPSALIPSELCQLGFIRRKDQGSNCQINWQFFLTPSKH